MTYAIVENGEAIRCLICGKTSHSRNDILQRYCAYCHVFHEDVDLNELDRGPR